MPRKNERPTISNPSHPSGIVWGEQTDRPRHTAGSAVPQSSVWGNDPTVTRSGNAPSAERQYDAGSFTSSDESLIFQGIPTTTTSTTSDQVPAPTQHDMTTSRLSFGSTQPPSSAGSGSPPAPDWPPPAAGTQQQQQRYQPPMASRFSSDTDDRSSSPSDSHRGGGGGIADPGMKTAWYDSSPESERGASDDRASPISDGSTYVLIGVQVPRESIRESGHEDDD